MARYNPDADLSPLYDTMDRLRTDCLIGDGSLLSPGRSLWTTEHFAELQRTYVQNLDEGEGKFFEKLKVQLSDATAEAHCLMSERLNYDRLYQEALGDPELKRTAVELEAALANAREAREVVFDLFQDLEGFSLDDYKPFSDVSTGLERLVDFLSVAMADRNLRLSKVDAETIDLLTVDGARRIRFTLNRDVATSSETCDLLGLDHPVVQEELGRWRSLNPNFLGVEVVRLL
ncbi:hypothetical protein IQ03_05190 [Gemmobacter caeni]|uniref:Uncharacterized protein n=1 Tax=Gemmobacter caeni TaxID=589035 RepID=A0A2T6A3M0_9RHOB|nr:hypothetical protein [Gemmobacter caeni]PTX38403.1 hypothetical protein C8N34_1431 [Gemmobacter caeni]TWI89786.1 hypothetical protein IQ03_05190 [Gemmobacter caeni]